MRNYEFIHQKTTTAKRNKESVTSVSLGELSFNVFHKSDSFKSRIKMINEVTQWVCEYLHKQPDSQLTFVSMGAGDLLMEHLIHQQITKSGVSDKQITWHCIDINYSRENPFSPGRSTGHAGAKTQFKLDKNVDYFTTANTYLSEMATAGQQLQARDKENNATIILAFNPPTYLHSGGLETSVINDSYIVSGSPCNIENANSVFLVIGANNQKSELEKFAGSLDPSKSWLASITPTIKVSINAGGEPEIWLSEALKKQFTATAHPKLRNSVIHHMSQPDIIGSPIAKAEKALYELRENLVEIGMCAVVLPYSEYNDSIDQLTTHFYRSKKDSFEQSAGALFRLQNKQIAITDSADFGAMKKIRLPDRRGQCSFP